MAVLAPGVHGCRSCVVDASLIHRWRPRHVVHLRRSIASSPVCEPLFARTPDVRRHGANPALRGHRA